MVNHKFFRKPRIIILVICSLVLFFGFIVTPSILIGLGYNDVFTFKLLPLNNVINTEITCYVKSTGFTLKQNVAGTVVSQGTAKQSNFYIKNPTTIFSIVDKEGVQDPITSFKIYPKVRCDIPNTNTKYPMELAATDLKLEVYSQNEKQTKVLTYTDVKRINPTKLSDNGEVTLAEFIVDPYKIEQALKTTGYDSYQEFRISGNLNLNYDGFESVVYQVNIPSDKVKITFYTTIGKNDDNGTPSIDCPSNQLKKDGVCVPKCNDDQILVDKQCVPKPVECKANEVLVDGKCVPKPEDDEQKDPKVDESDPPQNILADWFNALLKGDFNTLQQARFLMINVIVGLLLFVMVFQALKPKKV